MYAIVKQVDKTPTTFRLEPEKLRALKKLALDNDVKLNEAITLLVDQAIQAKTLTGIIKRDAGHGREAVFSLDQKAEMLARAVADEVLQDFGWAKRAIIKSLITGGADIFGFRTDHHAKEKQFLATNLKAWLTRRLNHISKTHGWCLVLDAGTTVWWCAGAVAAALEEVAKELPRRKFLIVTNNIPAMETYLAHYRVSSASTAPVECRTLPGKLAPGYASIVGPQACDAIAELRSQMPSDEVKFLALLGGNWNRISTDREPIPLTSEQDHRSIKESIIEACDEVYLVTCLAKIFVYLEPTPVNDLLISAGITERGSYKDVKLRSAKTNAVRLVSTTRPPNRLLSQHASAVRTALGGLALATDLGDFAEREYRDVPHLLWEFDPHDLGQEDRIEFPYLDLKDPPSDGAEKFLRHFQALVQAHTSRSVS